MFEKGKEFVAPKAKTPAEKAIIAALRPASTGYYFFCHKPATDKEAAVAYYAVTYAEQVANEIEAGLRKE